MKKNNKKRKNTKKKKAIAIALSSALVVAPATDAVAAITSQSLGNQIITAENTGGNPQDEHSIDDIDKYIDENINSDYQMPIEEAIPQEASPYSEVAPFNLTPETRNSVEVNIPDAKLKSALNEELNKRFNANKALDAPITQAEMESFTGPLSLNGKEITNPTGISAAKNITELSLNSNYIDSLPDKVLSDMPKLQKFYINSNGLTKINPMAFWNLPSLAYFLAVGNQITSISQNNFINMPSLKALYLFNNNISTIEPGVFNGVPALYYLEIQNNKLTDLRPEYFAGSALSNVKFNDNQISTIYPGTLDNFTNMTFLDISNNQLTSFDNIPINKMPQLMFFNISNNKLSNIPSNIFSSSTKLTTLKLNNNKIDFLPYTIFSSLPSNSIIDISSNKLKDISNFSTTPFTINATNQSVSIDTLLDNKYDLFSIPTSALSSIKGFGTTLSTFESSIFQGASNVSLSQDKSSANFKVPFPNNENASSIKVNYSLPSTNPSKHSYSATVTVPVQRDLSLINYINSTLSKTINEINLSDATNLIKIDEDFKSQTSDAQKYIQDSCPSFSKLPDYLPRSNNMKKIENYQGLINPTDKSSINSFIDTIKSLSPTQCVELKSKVNGILTLGLDLIKPELDKYHLDSITVNDKFEIRKLSEEISAITASIESIAAKNSTIISLDVQQKMETLNRGITPLLNKILELEAAQHVEELTAAINKVINISVDNITLENSKTILYIHKTLYSLDKVNQDKVLSSFPDFNLKMPQLFERSNVISDIQNYNDFNTSSYNELSKLVQKSFILSQSQKLQLSREINSIFTLSVSLFENDVNKLSLDTIGIKDKENVLSLSHNLNSLNESITEMNKLAGNNIVASSTQSKAISLLGKLKSFSDKITELENVTSSVDTIVESVNSFINILPQELTLEEAEKIVTSSNQINKLSDALKDEFLSKVDSKYEANMPSLLNRANKLLAIKNYSYALDGDKAKLKELVKFSSDISYNQRVSLKSEINSIFTLTSNILKNDASKYSLNNVKVSDKASITSLKDETSSLLSSITLINTNSSTASLDLLASSSYLLSDASLGARIVSVEMENQLIALSETLDSLLAKIAELEKTNPTKPGGGSSNGGTTGGTTNGGSTSSGGTSSGGTSSGGSYYTSSLNSDKLAQTGQPLASLILVLGSASLLGGGYALFKRRKK